MSVATVTRRRILIGAGSFADAETAIAIAERIAEAVAADLGGVMVEEPDAAGVSGLPCQRVVTSSGMLVVAPSSAQMRILLASDARAFRARLSRVAEARALHWSFERRRGELVSGLWEAARSWDLLLLGHRPISRRRGSVVAILPPGPTEIDARALAETLASALGTGIVTMTPMAGTEAEAEEALLRRVSRTNAAVVIVDLGAGPVRGPDALRRLLDAARCPVLVIGAGRVPATIAHTTQIPPAPNEDGST
ncbi:hypothetical protein R5H32_17515 [Defluviimonas sp. D31]|uniref:hypothetical protein n=1 Tax=Defluviimonas sp. D31 TaxID=3083253 RepID=UPI00296E30AB|nr:hypothetical protein [Defluviimonas sp. D31]MDW4551164.1 hypothetical protein [Defluviimonas sp. D31]